MHPRKRASGVTLLRVMLWVYGVTALLIIAFFLLNFFFAPSLGPRVEPRRWEAEVNVNAIVTALHAYHDDYGHYPEIVKPLLDGKRMICVGDSACKISDGPNNLLLNVLRAIPHGANANHALNPKKVNYIETEVAMLFPNPRGGFADGQKYHNVPQGCLFDPWGRQYCVVFTVDDSGTLDLSAVYSDLVGPEHLIRSPVAAFSLGKDGIPGGKGYEGKFRKPASSEPPDDIVSWQ